MLVCFSGSFMSVCKHCGIDRDSCDQDFMSLCPFDSLTVHIVSVVSFVAHNTK